MVSVGTPTSWVLAQVADAYDVIDGCARPSVSAAVARTSGALDELTDAISHGDRPEWVEEWLDYCGFRVRGDLVWPKNRKVADEIAMTLAYADSPLTIRDLRDRLINSPSLTTVRNRLSNDPRFQSVQRGVWGLATNQSECQAEPDQCG